MKKAALATQSQHTHRNITQKRGYDNTTVGRDQHRLKIIHREVSKAGLRGKINAKCAECIYDPYQPGTWLKQVEICTSKGCPLYDVRPSSKAKSGDIAGQLDDFSVSQPDTKAMA